WSVAPFEAHLVSLGGSEEVRDQADRLYAQLLEAGIEVLYDDRDESAGVKFADADLIGIPVRLTVSARSLKAGGVELKPRSEGKDAARIIALDDVAAEVTALRAAQM